LLMSRTFEYAEQAAAIQRLVGARGIFNICGKLNAISHPNPRVSSPLNQTIFGATYYAAALAQLMRGGADGELYWMGTDPVGSHGLWDGEGRPTPAFHAKRLVAKAFRFGDEFVVKEPSSDRRGPLVLRAQGIEGRRSALIVHLADEARAYELAEI